MTEATEFFENGGYNVTGQIEMQGVLEGHNIHAVYNLVGNGTWDGNADSLTIRLQNFKSFPISISDNNKLIDLHMLKLFTGPVPVLENSIPQGMLQTYEIKALTGKVMKLETRDPLGGLLSIAATKLASPLD